MPAKKTTIATAEKRVIKAELSTLKKAVRKIEADHRTEQTRINKESRNLERLSIKSTNASQRAKSTAVRRIAILEGRLFS